MSLDYLTGEVVDARVRPAAQIDEAFCPSLPSSSSAHDFIRGVPGSTLRVMRDFLGRSAIIRLGIEGTRLWGEKPPKNAWQLSFLGGAAIEAFVLLYLATTMRAAQNNPR